MRMSMEGFAAGIARNPQETKVLLGIFHGNRIRSHFGITMRTPHFVRELRNQVMDVDGVHIAAIIFLPFLPSVNS